MRRFTQSLSKGLAALCLLVTLTGCASSSALSDTRASFVAANPGLRVERTASFGAGPLTMGLARRVLRASGDSSAREVAGMLRHVRRASVRVYETRGGAGGAGSRTPALSAHLRRQGWTPLLRARGDDGEATWILVRERRGRIVGMLVAALDDESLVLVETTGRLDRLVEDALARYSGDGWRAGD